VLTGAAATATAVPTVAGIPVTGQTLTGSTGTWSTAGLGFAYQWLRDGSPIAGATGAAYALVAADAGHAITVRVTATRAGYADGQATSGPTSATGPVAATARLNVRKRLKAGQRAVATVKVAGAYDPSGRVVVTFRPVDGRAITVSGQLSNGSLKLTSPKLAAGSYRVVATYDGDDLHRSAKSSTVRVVVKAKRGR
jgi:hypothetical protein